MKKINPNRITIEVDGEVIGSINSWTIPKETKAIDYTPIRSLSASSFWDTEVPIQTSGGKSTLGLQCLVKMKAQTEPPGLLIRAQLEMWGIQLGDPCPVDCLALLIQELEAAGYHVWFDSEASLDSDAVTHVVDMNYTSIGEQDE